MSLTVSSKLKSAEPSGYSVVEPDWTWPRFTVETLPGEAALDTVTIFLKGRLGSKEKVGVKGQRLWLHR